MNISKVAIYKKPGTNLNLSVKQIILNMFEHTDENGILYIPAWPGDDFLNEKQLFYKIKMNWSKDDAEKIIEEYIELYKSLEKLAENWDELKDDEEKVKALPENLQKVWNTFCRTLESDDRVCEAEKRVGKSIASFDFVIRAVRVCRLMSLGAPGIVLDGEAELLVQALAVHKFGETKNTVENIE